MTETIDLQSLKEVELTNCLTKAGLGLYYHRYFFNYGVKEAAYLASKHEINFKHGRGRPNEVAKGLSVEDQLRLVEMYYRGYDLLTIHQLLSPVSINKIFYFLRIDDTSFGYRICSCGKPFIYVSLGKHTKCKSCQKDNNLVKNIRNVDFILSSPIGDRTFENANKNPNSYNSMLLEKMKAHLLDICYSRKLLKDMVQQGRDVLSHIANHGSKGNKDAKVYLSSYDMDMRLLKELMADYDRVKERMLPTSKNSSSKRRDIDRGAVIMMQ